MTTRATFSFCLPPLYGQSSAHCLLEPARHPDCWLTQEPSAQGILRRFQVALRAGRSPAKTRKFVADLFFFPRSTDFQTTICTKKSHAIGRRDKKSNFRTRVLTRVKKMFLWRRSMLLRIFIFQGVTTRTIEKQQLSPQLSSPACERMHARKWVSARSRMHASPRRVTALSAACDLIA
jgi:hypothetical protein